MSAEMSFWKEFPFVRISLPFIIGIVLARYASFRQPVWFGTIFFVLTGNFIITCTSVNWQFRLRYARGMLINLLMIGVGAIIASARNPFTDADKIYRAKPQTSFYIARITEPPQEKKNSWKALAEVSCINKNGKVVRDAANVVIYFRKDSLSGMPDYGDSIAFIRPPERIKNFLEGAAFNYKEYCALKNIHYQIFLRAGDFVKAGTRSTDLIHRCLFATQRHVLIILRKHIAGRKECGLAEALLIGYKNDLDRMLMQSYSNTGVVHVVAISGLHLGLVYMILGFLSSPIRSKFQMPILRCVIIIAGLWAFSFLAGASPSVLRSAVMFTVIVLGECFRRRSNVINNLAASAFLLLCADPFWLWDLGFLLSYTALLALVIFMKPIYRLIVIENKYIDAIWKMIAETIAAQILTMPILIYYFNQFPNLFIITNLIAIPLSSIILVGEILLVIVSFTDIIARILGICISFLVKMMNLTVELMDSFSFSSTRGLEINIVQLTLLYVFIGCVSSWLILKRKLGLHMSLIALILFFVAANYKLWQ